MASVRKGQRAVLLVVDVQVGVMAEAWESPRVIAQVAQAVARARSAGLPVLWVQHASDDLASGTPAWQWVPELVPAPGECLIPKHYNSAFEDTALDAELDRLQASHIVLAGAASNWCIRATAYGALDRGYDLTLLADAHTTGSMQLEDGSRVEARSVVQDLNIAMTWLRYPGRRNAALPVAGFDFAAAAASR